MHSKKVLIMLFQVLFLSALESVSGQTSKCLAVITEISGDVSISKAGRTESEKAFWGAQLFQGDQISTKEKSVVSLLMANSSLIKLESNSKMTISAKESSVAVVAGNLPEPMTAAMISGFSSLISRKEAKEEKGSLAGLRSFSTMGQSIRLTSPYNTLIKTNRPSFSWNTNNPYDYFTVNLYNSSGLVWSKKSNVNTMEFPENEKELEYGESYFWNVDGEKLIGVDKSPNQRFSVLPLEKVSEAEALETSIRNNFMNQSECSTLHSVLGAYFMNEGLLQDAVNEFHIISEMNPEAPLPHELLGSIYSDMGDKDKAISELQKALELSKNKDK